MKNIQELDGLLILIEDDEHRLAFAPYMFTTHDDWEDCRKLIRAKIKTIQPGDTPNTHSPSAPGADGRRRCDGRMKTGKRIALSVVALVIGMAIPLAATLYFGRLLNLLYGPAGPLTFRGRQMAIRVALCAAVLLVVALWQLTAERVWHWRSVRTAWCSAIALALMYGQWVIPTFVCLCSIGGMIGNMINGFLLLLIVRFAIALAAKDSPAALAFYLPVMFGVPVYINHVVRSLTGHW